MGCVRAGTAIGRPTHLALKELVLQRLVASPRPDAVEQRAILGVVLGHAHDLVVVVAVGELHEPLGVQAPWVSRASVQTHTNCRKQLHTVVLGQLRAKGVDGNVECTAVGFELHS